MKRIAAGAVALFVTVSVPVAAHDAGFPAKGSITTAERRTLVFDGAKHPYLIQAVLGGGLHPVVVLLHGGDSGATRVWVETSLPTLGRRDGFILVAPDASTNKHWNDGRGTVGEGKASHRDDVGYLKALIAEVVGRFRGDASAVFMVGISNGGIMTMHFACKAGYVLRAGGNVISNLTVKDAKTCVTRKPLPWVSINGDADPRMPFRGLTEGSLISGRPQAGLESADRTFNFFADKARCERGIRVRLLLDAGERDGSTAEKRVRGGCIGGTTSTQYVLHHAGHNVPGLAIDAARERQFGRTNQDIDAGTVIWDHFRQTLPNARTNGRPPCLDSAGTPALRKGERLDRRANRQSDRHQRVGGVARWPRKVLR